MLIRRVRIERFRSIEFLDLELGAATVLIGPNNAGKTAILEAIRIALTRRWGQRGTGFTEYDIHLKNEGDDPKTSKPVVIEIEIAECVVGEWHPDIHADLSDVIQVDPVDGRGSIILRVSCGWDQTTGAYVPRWEFLNVVRAPLAGKGARGVNFQEFFQYMPMFYLAALRDADDEFSNRSQFWGRLLRSVQIPEALEQKSKKVFDALNRKLLAADPRLQKLASTLSTVSQIAISDHPGSADLRLTPLRAWDLISKAEIIFRGDTNKPWLPLGRHGQGVQSLSVLFLFRAFVEQLLTDLFKSASSPLLALEEPETHLHPQAARTLWKHITNLPGQKIVTTHSPYFLQHVPFRDLRIIRISDSGTSSISLPASFRSHIPHIATIDPLILNSRGLISYDRHLGDLVVNGELNEVTFRKLLIAYGSHPEKDAIFKNLRSLKDASSFFITDDELAQLETFARRIRGEIFFSRQWVLVEGQGEFHLLHGIARGLGFDLDENGISVIDFQNCGNPAIFAALARALAIPWLAIVDGDTAGKKYLDDIANRGIPKTEVQAFTTVLTQYDLEHQLVHDGLQAELKQVLADIGHSDSSTLSDQELILALGRMKGAYPPHLAKLCSSNPSLSARMPEAFRKTIQSLRGS